MIETTCGILSSISVFLILENSLYRKIFGIVLLSTVINIIILLSGGLDHKLPAFVGENNNMLSNPVPQALILTAIVIGFGLLIFLCVLFKVIKQE